MVDLFSMSPVYERHKINENGMGARLLMYAASTVPAMVAKPPVMMAWISDMVSRER